jgi:peptide/nickel transport system permease protein
VKADSFNTDESPSSNNIVQKRHKTNGLLFQFLSRFKSHKFGMLGLSILILLIALTIIAPWLTPFAPNKTNLNAVLLPPGIGGHIVGTDELGRDVFSRLLVGGRVSLIAAIQGTGLALLIGVPVGLVSGYMGGRVDKLIMFFTDILMSFPAMLLAMAIAGILGPNLVNAMIAIGVIASPRAIRLVRGSSLAVREETYIEAARSIGTTNLAIILRHIFPNILPPLIVFTTVLGGTVMLMEAGLSFLGLGVQPPQASWGSMLGTALGYTTRAPWLAIFPGLCIAISVLSLNLVGDGVRDSIGKKVRR